MDKEAFFRIICEDPIWDFEVLLARLKITETELILLLRSCSDTLEWTLNNHYAHHFLSNSTVVHELISRTFEFCFHPALSPVHCRCGVLHYAP